MYGWRVNQENTGEWIANVVDEANARAIACLPDLVEAARAAVDSGRFKDSLSKEALRRVLARIDGEEA